MVLSKSTKIGTPQVKTKVVTSTNQERCQHWSALAIPQSEPEWYSSTQDQIGNLLKSKTDLQSLQIKKTVNSARCVNTGPHWSPPKSEPDWY